MIETKARSRQVARFALPLSDYVELRVPRGSVLLSLENEMERIYLHALTPCDTQEYEIRHLRIYGSASAFATTEVLKFIGSVLRQRKTLHVFEITE